MDRPRCDPVMRNAARGSAAHRSRKETRRLDISWIRDESDSGTNFPETEVPVRSVMGELADGMRDLRAMLVVLGSVDVVDDAMFG